jgi:hypothetical protein
MKSCHCEEENGSAALTLHDTMTDPTEEIRRALTLKLNGESAERADLERRHGQVWNPAELAAEFEVMEFAAPLVVVRRRSDAKLGSLFFQHHPRFYFEFEEDEP